MSNGPRFAIVDRRVNGQNRTAVQTFARLANASTERALKPAEVKRFARLQTQLMRSGVVVLLTKKVVTEQARAIYAALPWWKKLLLRVRFHLLSARNRIRNRFELTKLRLRS